MKKKHKQSINFKPQSSIHLVITYTQAFYCSRRC